MVGCIALQVYAWFVVLDIFAIYKRVPVVWDVTYRFRLRILVARFLVSGITLRMCASGRNGKNVKHLKCVTVSGRGV